MGFGRARSAAATVASRASAEQDDHIARCGTFAADIFLRRRTDHRADLHMLRDIAVVIDFIDLARGKTDLVAVGGIAGRGRRHNLALRELARNGFGNRNRRIRGAGHTHRRVNIGASRQRVADRAADTGRSAAERLNFRRMVVRFILEKQEPRLLFAVDLDRDFYRAGVDFVGFVELCELSRFFQRFRGDRRDIH